ncbi:MAG: FAD-linked oxidase C-terminal domain-containing protein [Woeseia sp.]
MSTISQIPADNIEQLNKMLSGRIITSRSKLQHFTTSESHHEGPLPQGLVQPASTAEVAEIARACNQLGVPMIPYGAGTSLEGHTLAIRGGIIVDMTAMNEVIEVNTADQDCRCQPGVTREKLNSYIRDTGLTFPIDPGADASIGGMVATSASGTNAVRYGTMKENVLSLEAVLADGSIIRTGRRARKSSAGLDLTSLLIGSEGTLGIVTEITLRLHGIPECTRAAACSFDSAEAAVDAVALIIQLAIPVARLEFMDEAQVNACNRFSGKSEPEEPTLLIEFHGNQVETDHQIEQVKEIVRDFGGRNFRWSQSEAERQALWRYRYDALPAAKALRAGCHVLITDVCVPIASLSECVTRCREKITEKGMLAPIVGHVGDGNFHALFVIDRKNEKEMADLEEVVEWMNDLALSFDGTVTGEHGIGIGKQGALIKELGAASVQAMAHIKNALDPKGIMNPGKIFGR